MTDFLRDREPSFVDSPAESQRFGLSVARLTVPMGADPETTLPWLREILTTTPHDLVVLRYPARHATWAASLLGLGREVVHADTLVYFTRRLDREPVLPSLGLGAHDGMWTAFRDREVDPVAIGGLIDSVFAGFSNHYASNPLLDEAAVLAGYREWVEASIRNEHVLCVTDDLGPAAFITWSDDGPVCELKLGGVHPRVQGRGLFGAVLLEAAASAQRAGCTELDSPTQVQNLRQLAVSWRIGLRAGGACVTAHALRNGLLTAPRV